MGASQGALESGGIPGGIGEWGRLQVALYRVWASTGGSGVWGGISR